MARELGGYNDPQAREQAYVDVALAIDNHVAQKENFSIETLYSGSRGPDIVERAAEAGYAIKCHFIGTKNILINLGRVVSRTIDRGANVPPEVTKKAWINSKENLKETAHMMQTIMLYDNSEEKANRMATLDGRQLRNRDPDALPWVIKFVDDIAHFRGNIFDRSRDR